MECLRIGSEPRVLAYVTRLRNVLKRIQAQDIRGGVQSKRP